MSYNCNVCFFAHVIFTPWITHCWLIFNLVQLWRETQNNTTWTSCFGILKPRLPTNVFAYWSIKYMEHLHRKVECVLRFGYFKTSRSNLEIRTSCYFHFNLNINFRKHMLLQPMANCVNLLSVFPTMFYKQSVTLMYW